MAHNIESAMREALGDLDAELRPEGYSPEGLDVAGLKWGNERREARGRKLAEKMALTDPFANAEAAGCTIATGHDGSLDDLDGDWSDLDIEELDFDLN